MATKTGTVSLADASVGSIMTREVKTVTTTTPVVESIRKMKDSNIGSIVIIEDTRPVGIFTERDLVKKIAEKLDTLGLPMAQVMSKPLVTISPTATVWDALILMAGHNIRRLPVLEGKKLVGIVTERDVFRLILAQQSLLLESVYESLPPSSRERLRGIVGALGIERPPTRVSGDQ
jgi:CBS domain-containing protein